MDRYPILISWSDEDGEYVGIVPDLEGCSASGATVEDAARETQTAMRLWLEVAREEGYPIPAPTLPAARQSVGAPA